MATRWVTSPIERLFVATYTLFGFAAESFPIGDNSAFVHLRTGRLIADGAGIPRSDPYSATASGHSWVVQSWLPEWTYGWLWRWGGLHLVVFEQALLAAAIAWLTALLARAGSPLRTAGAAGLAIGVGAPLWSPRPLLFGILALALTILIVERRASPLWLVPVVWVWVNSHGSFPLGLLWLGAVATGYAIDHRSLRRSWTILGPYAVAFGAGLGLAMVNPLGPRLLAFPLTLGEKRSIFRLIVEWRSPNFQAMPESFALVFLALTLIVLLRSRLAFTDVVPVVGFVVLSLVALRNLPMLSPVLAPVLARALARPAEEVPAAPPEQLAGFVPRAFAAVLAAAALLFAAAIWSRAPLELEGYPVAAVDRLEAAGMLTTGRLAHQDTTGGYLILREGERAQVFIDDRIDMYPVEVARDYVTLLHGQPSALEVLDRHDIDVVLWEPGRPLIAILVASPEWGHVFSEDGWMVFGRRGGSGILADD